MDQAAHKGAGGQHHGGTQKTDAAAGIHPAQFIPLQIQRRYLPLLDMQVILLLQNSLHPQAIELLVSLSATGSHRWSLTGVQHPELNSGSVDVPGHLTSEGIDLTHQVPFGQTANGRVTGHYRHAVQTHVEQQRQTTHSRSSQGGLATSVTGTNHNHIVCRLIAMHTCHHVSRGTPSLTYTERRKNTIQQIVRSGLAGDLAECRQRRPDIQRQQFRRKSGP